MPRSSRLPVKDVQQVAQMIGIDTASWPGRCAEIAHACWKAGCVDKAKYKEKYGFYTGPVAPTSIFYKGSISGGMVRHGWLECVGGNDKRTIYDPTAWAFTLPENPYIQVSQSAKVLAHYDPGMRQIRVALAGNTGPAYAPGEKEYMLNALPVPVREYVIGQFVGAMGDRLSLGQLFWLGNRPPELLKPHAKTIYKWIIKIGQKAIIPQDFRKDAGI